MLQTYDKIAISALIGTLRMLFELRPRLQVLISGAVRNEETFETFRHACREESQSICPRWALMSLRQYETNSTSKRSNSKRGR